MKTRITELLGIEIPVVQAPMGYIARAQLASAVSAAGATMPLHEYGVLHRPCSVGFCGVQRRGHGHHRDILGSTR